MPAYIAFLIDIRDQAAFTSHARAAAPTYALYGGSVALRGPIVDIIEGNLEAEPQSPSAAPASPQPDRTAQLSHGRYLPAPRGRYRDELAGCRWIRVRVSGRR